MNDEIRRGSRRNFFIVDNGVFDERLQLEALDKLVYICLLRYADNNTREAFPGMQRIANDIGITRRRVITAIERLIDKKLIQKKERFDITGSQKSNLYIVFDANEVINRGCTEFTGGVNHVHRGGELSSLEGVNHVHTKKTDLKILSEEEAANAKENIKKLKDIAKGG